MNDKSIVSMAKGEYGYKSTSHYVTRTCPQCGEEYRRYPGEVEYKYGGKLFCHFPCKNQYRKAHPDEELTLAETMALRCETNRKQSVERARQKHKQQKGNYPKYATSFTKTELIAEIIKLNPTYTVDQLKGLKREEPGGLIEIYKKEKKEWKSKQKKLQMKN